MDRRWIESLAADHGHTERAVGSRGTWREDSADYAASDALLIGHELLEG